METMRRQGRSCLGSSRPHVTRQNVPECNWGFGGFNLLDPKFLKAIRSSARCAHHGDGGLHAVGLPGRRGGHAAGGGQVQQQAAGRPVGRVHRAHEAPGVRQQLAHGRRAQLLEVGAAVDAAEVRQVPAPAVQGLPGFARVCRLCAQAVSGRSGGCSGSATGTCAGSTGHGVRVRV